MGRPDHHPIAALRAAWCYFFMSPTSRDWCFFPAQPDCCSQRPSFFLNTRASAACFCSADCTLTVVHCLTLSRLSLFGQVLGAIAGAAVQVIITPSLAFFQPYDPSCHQPMTGLGGTPLYFWETLAAFVFVYVAYPALFARPNYGSIGPLFVGLALFGVLSTGECWFGAADDVWLSSKAF